MKKYLIYALAGVMLAACGKEELPESGPNDTSTNEDIRFEIGIASPVSEAGPQTRVATDENFKCTWEAGDAIGVFAFEEGVSVTSENYYIRNVKLTYDGTSWKSETPLYWPGNSKKLQFYACYPYNAADGVKGFDFIVKADQRADTEGKSNLDLSDLMLTFGVWTAKGNPIDLVFSKHYASMVELKLDDPHHQIGQKEVTVKLRDVARKGSFTFQSFGWTAMTGTDVGDITMRRVEQPGDADYHSSYTFRAIVPLQEPFNKGKSLFLISIGNLKLDSSKLKDDFGFSTGNAYRFIEKIPSWK